MNIEIPEIRILNLAEAEKCLCDPPEDFQFTHVVSLGEMEEAPESLFKTTAKVLRLSYVDLTYQNYLEGKEKGFTPPSHGTR